MLVYQRVIIIPPVVTSVSTKLKLQTVSMISIDSWLIVFFDVSDRNSYKYIFMLVCHHLPQYIHRVFLAVSTPGFCAKLHGPIFAPTHGAVQRQNGAGKGTKVPAIWRKTLVGCALSPVQIEAFMHDHLWPSMHVLSCWIPFNII